MSAPIVEAAMKKYVQVLVLLAALAVLAVLAACGGPAFDATQADGRYATQADGGYVETFDSDQNTSSLDAGRRLDAATADAVGAETSTTDAGALQDGGIDSSSVDSSSVDSSSVDSNAGCATGAVRCAGLQPQMCVSGAWWENGAACSGACLDGACELPCGGAGLSVHHTGTGLTWTDCAPVGVHDSAQAGEACRVWCAANSCSACTLLDFCGGAGWYGYMSANTGMMWVFGPGSTYFGKAVTVEGSTCAVTGSWD
jgi:hypothetical protein